MEPASSSDDDSSIDEQSSSLRPSSSLLEKHEEVEDFDQLPSDDSCLDSDSDSDSDSESDSDDDNDDNDDNDYDSSQNTKEDVEEMALGDRIYDKQHNMGVRRDKSKFKKKSQALEIAQKRLLEMKRKKRNLQENDHDDDDNDDDNDNHEKEEEEPKRKTKKSKHAPTSASSKRSAFYSRGAPDLNSSGIGIEIGANRYKPRDPRHQSLSGHFDHSVFEKRYEFLEKIQDDEINATKKRVKAWKTTGKKGQKMRKKLGMTMSSETDVVEDEAELHRLLQERASRAESKIRTAAKRSVKKKLREDVASGKRGAYYLKKRDMKKMELEAKFEELKKLGGDKKVNQAMAKRRKKKMGKDSSFMPKAT